MAITAATRTSIIQLVVTANNAAPGTTLLNSLVAESEGGASLASIAATLTASSTFASAYPSFQTATEFATEFLGNLIPQASAAALAEGITVIEGLLNGGSTRADVVLQASTYLAGLSETHVSFGTSAANFNNKVEVAAYHSINLELDTGMATALTGVTSDDATVTTAKAAADLVKTPAAVAATTYTLTADAVNVVEGDSGQANMVFNLELDKAAEADVVVNYESLTTGTGSAGSDFDSASGAVTFVAGQTNASVLVKVNGDTTVESDETVKVTFSGSDLVASVTETGTITNDDTAAAAATTYTLTSSSPSMTETDSGDAALVFTLTLSAAAEVATTVNYETLTTGTATAGTDFDAQSSSVTFGVGQTSASVAIVVNGDTTVESDETVKVKFSGSTLTADVTGTGTISNDDTAAA
ncbi:MAG: Calx-beta domain-containing protein, partial [Gammaproteobacteria bacterium]|nr:Calx-beta domain-containing protein [Gammaproteobacteria bacterium]